MNATPSISSSSFTIPKCTCSQRFQAMSFNPICHSQVKKHREGRLFIGSRSLQCFTSNHTTQTNSNTKRNLVVYCELPPAGGPLPFGGLPGSWKSWLLGVLFTVAIPLLTNKWGTILNWTKKIDSAVQRVEDIVETVENVAEKVDKITEDIVDDLPEGKLKEAVSRIENAAEKIAKDAHQIDNIIDKVQEAEENFEDFIEKSDELAKAKVKKEV